MEVTDFLNLYFQVRNLKDLGTVELGRGRVSIIILRTF